VGRVLVSEPVVLALAVEIGRWSGVASSWAQWTAGIQWHDMAAWEGLESARLCMSAAARATGTAGTRLEATVGRELLRAAPLYAVPERVPPHAAEDREGLCWGIVASADRIRQEAFAPAGGASTARCPGRRGGGRRRRVR
jgi:hypothetical protein